MEIRQSLVVPVTDACDVLVCGGGFAGVSAAMCLLAWVGISGLIG